MHFVYVNAKGEVSERRLTSVTEKADLIQGYCTTTEALKTFRRDRILEWLEPGDNAEERLEHYRNHPPAPELYQAQGTTKRRRDELDVVFTGFPKAEKERLVELAKEHGLVVRTGVTNSLNFLCCGPNAGPAKIAKAREIGALAFDVDALFHMLETGEILD